LLRPLTPRSSWLRGLDLNQRPLGYELLQPPPITGLYEPPDGKSWHIAAGHATPAQPERRCRTLRPARTFQVGPFSRVVVRLASVAALLFPLDGTKPFAMSLREDRRTVASTFSSSQFRNPSPRTGGGDSTQIRIARAAVLKPVTVAALGDRRGAWVARRSLVYREGGLRRKTIGIRVESTPELNRAPNPCFSVERTPSRSRNRNEGVG